MLALDFLVKEQEQEEESCILGFRMIPVIFTTVITGDDAGDDFDD